MRVISAALAACMMASVLPVSAFASGGGTGSESSVSTQEEIPRLEGGEEIKDMSGTLHYQMSGNYTQNVEINAPEADIVIDITGPITFDDSAAQAANHNKDMDLLRVHNVKTLTVNNTSNYQVDCVGNGDGWGCAFLRAHGAGPVTVMVEHIHLLTERQFLIIQKQFIYTMLRQPPTVK